MRTKRPRGRMGTIMALKQIGAYIWIGLVNPGPPPLPRTKPLKRGEK
jgi:hypothetical protein